MITTKKIITSIKAVLLAVILLGSLATQTASAFDSEFYAGNDILFYNPESCKFDVGGSDADLVGNTGAEMIWSYLVGKGLSAEQAAGVMGNLQAESGFVPTRHQSTLDVWNDEGGRAWGIAQWDRGRRYTAPDNGILGKLRDKHPNLVKYVDIAYDPVRHPGATVPLEDFKVLLGFELDFLFDELNSRPANRPEYKQYSNEWEMLKGQSTIEDALVAFHHEFEISHLMNRPDPRTAVIQARGDFAQKAYNDFKNFTAPAAGTPGGGTSTAPIIFVDPGHGGAVPQYIDPITSLADRETGNPQETEDVLDVSKRIKAELETAGYQVILSRSTNEDKKTKRERADAAATAKASMGISLHTTPGEVNEVWPQRTGTYREYNGKRVVFADGAVSTKSESYANILAKTRTAAEGHQVTTDPGNVRQAEAFGRGDIPSKGNIPLISLWSPTIPWVYNEIAQNAAGSGINETRKAAYTKGIVDGVKQALPTSTTDNACKNGATFSGGNLPQTTLAYAWPTYRGLTIDAKPEWDAAWAKARSEGRYIGGIRHPGIDCGGFVTNLIYDSGYDKGYNYEAKGGNTRTQETWLRANWERLGRGSDINPADLRAGDVAIKSELDGFVGHTFIFVDRDEIKKATGQDFASDIASASLDERAPMAGKESPTGGDFTWYRKK